MRAVDEQGPHSVADRPSLVAYLLVAALAFAGCPRAPRLAIDLRAHTEPDVERAVHVVEQGETLWRIARRYGVKADALARANGIEESATIKAGQELVIPPAAQEPAATVAAAAPTPAATATAPPKAAVARLAWPLVGVLYARFGPRGEAHHDGVDVAAPEGSEIVAAADGEVVFAGEQKGYGNLVILGHADSLITVYAHNRENLVKEGQKVSRGQRVAKVGMASRTSGPHLHFEVREGTVPKDPLEFLPPPL
jgi:lipoprotein NlpD